MIKRIKSQRGKYIIIHEGFLYNFDRNIGLNVRYRCRNRKCKGYIVLTDNDNIVELGNHSHPTSLNETRKLINLQNIKERAVTTAERPFDIISRELSSVETPQYQALPSIRSLVKVINRSRRTETGACGVLINDIPDVLRYDEEGKPFLKEDTGYSDENRIIVFSHDFKKMFAEQCEVLIVDGTFKSCPTGFFQVLVIHGYFLGQSFPLFYCLLKSKRQETYEKCFQICKTIIKLNPLYIISDFEKSLNNALCKIFTNTEIKGCFFHFAQSLWRRVQTTNLTIRYKNNIDIQKTLKYCIYLAFVPIDIVYNTYIYIKTNILSSRNITDNDKLALNEFFSYFEKTYIGTLNERLPSYCVKMWNISDIILKKIPRTINYAERWNRTLNERVSIRHPNIAHFINTIKQEEIIDKFNIVRAKSGLFKNDIQRLKYEEDIYIIVKYSKYYSIEEYLSSIDYIMKNRKENFIGMEENEE